MRGDTPDSARSNREGDGDTGEYGQIKDYLEVFRELLAATHCNNYSVSEPSITHHLWPIPTDSLVLSYHPPPLDTSMRMRYHHDCDNTLVSTPVTPTPTP